MNFYHCYYLKLHQINMNRQDLYFCWQNLRKWSYIFIITSNVGIFMTKKVLFWSFEIKSDEFLSLLLFEIKINVNRQDLYLCWQNLRKWSYIFIITSNVGIFMTKKVLKFIEIKSWINMKLHQINMNHRICIFVARI